MYSIFSLGSKLQNAWCYRYVCFYYLQRMVTTLGRRLYRHPLPCKLGCANWLSFTLLSGNENTSQAFALQKCWFLIILYYEIKTGSVSQTLSHIPFLQFQLHISSRAASRSPTGIRSLLVCLRFKSKMHNIEHIEK